MSNNQLHGKQFEDLIKATFPGSSDKSRGNTSKWDIEDAFDKEKNKPTSVKTSKNKTVDDKTVSVKAGKHIIINMAQAIGFTELDEDFRLLVGIYNQVGNAKVFFEVREYIITKEIHKKIIGELTPEIVKEFHNSLKTEPGKEGARKAREIAKEYKEKLKNKKTLLKLNSKVDSKNQRRLQCSIHMKDLDNLEDLERIIHKEEYRGLFLPIKIKSSSRTFKKQR